MHKTEPEAWKQGTTESDQRGQGEEGKGGKKEKVLVKEHEWMIRGHGQQGGDWLWERGVGWVEEANREKLGQL